MIIDGKWLKYGSNFVQLKQKSPTNVGLFRLTGRISYKLTEVALSGLCFVPSCGSKQPDKPPIIIAKARSDNTFFIMISSKRFKLFLYVR